MRLLSAILLVLLIPLTGRAGVGDPQLATDHPWYPGELACSTFDKLFATQAAVYTRVTGIVPTTDEHKALASWLWRNTHFWHGEEASQDLWGQGHRKGLDTWTRDYWTGLFSHGFGLCGTTHAQWSAELHHLLGPHRGRSVGVVGHNAFEVWLTGGSYGTGKWGLLDHDLSTVIFGERGEMVSIADIAADFKRLTSRTFRPERQRGWLISGLHPDDVAAYRSFRVAEYGPGYAGPTPMVHLRRGESFRRYLRPGLEDGKTFVFWGRNYKTAGIPGPERGRTWVNQPEKMYQATKGTDDKPGRARFANAVFTYVPDFATDAYREGVVREDDTSVVLEHNSPYLIAATPPDDSAWGVYNAGCRNGLTVRGQAKCEVSVSVDRGTTWHTAGRLPETIDLTDRVKGQRQYWLKLGAGAAALRGKQVTLTTVCQANAAVMPQLKDDGTKVRFAATGKAITSAGPTLPQAKTHLVAGAFGSPEVTLELATPRGEAAFAVHAATHVQSGNPPRPEVKYHIDVSLDKGQTWKPLVKDWTVPRRGVEPKDFWSQTFVWGTAEVNEHKGPVRVRFRNSARKNFARCEMHLIYNTGRAPTKVTFAWDEEGGPQLASQTLADGQRWRVKTGKNVRTRWVELTY